ncbi:MAG: MFS transporter [Myxococcales bacterium]|nr:MFS transporter [Myxococcales bacterium]
MSEQPAHVAQAPRPMHVLPVIVLAQFAGTSLWFAGNAVVSDLQRISGLGAEAVGWLTSAVQLGFIVGTLLFAILNVADRFRPRTVFASCALLAAGANAALVAFAADVTVMLALRFLVGFFLAGIYPVGMKIAASWYGKGLGRALGLLVGALVLGTAFPHLLRAGIVELEWTSTLIAVSALAAAGGLVLFATVPAGPHLPKTPAKFDPTALGRIFAKPDFRAAAFGYFGHMWELYAFWAVVPFLVTAVSQSAGEPSLNVPLWSFAIIAAGTVGCVVGGWASERWGSARVAAFQLAVSGLLCLASPWLIDAPASVALAALLLWGTVVVGDSPQFSALTAQTAPRQWVGTALTIVVSIGFLVTVPSIQLVTSLQGGHHSDLALLVLVPGPVLGLLGVRRLLRAPTQETERSAS